jgi:hypothetical protein
LKLRLSASTGTAIDVWREGDTYCARKVGTVRRPEVCLAVDLFEVVAELSGLNLDDAEQASEAMRLADHAQQELAEPDDEEGNGDDTTAASGRSS